MVEWAETQRFRTCDRCGVQQTTPDGDRWPESWATMVASAPPDFFAKDEQPCRLFAKLPHASSIRNLCVACAESLEKWAIEGMPKQVEAPDPGET